jgi:hypothetical protein
VSLKKFSYRVVVKVVAIVGLGFMVSASGCPDRRQPDVPPIPGNDVLPERPEGGKPLPTD